MPRFGVRRVFGPRFTARRPNSDPLSHPPIPTAAMPTDNQVVEPSAFQRSSRSRTGGHTCGCPSPYCEARGMFADLYRRLLTRVFKVALAADPRTGRWPTATAAHDPPTGSRRPTGQPTRLAHPNWPRRRRGCGPVGGLSRPWTRPGRAAVSAFAASTSPAIGGSNRCRGETAAVPTRQPAPIAPITGRRRRNRYWSPITALPHAGGPPKNGCH